MSETATKITMESVDEFLGPASDRFFGGAFSRVGHRIEDVRIGDGAVVATAAVEYPADWSKKDGVVHRPHLSTIDTVLIGAQLAEMYLTRAFRLTDEQRGRMWLRRVEMRPGATPQEDLTGFPVSARYVSSGQSGSSPDVASVIDCRVGTVKLRCEVVHDSNGEADPDGHFRTADDVLGDADRRHYGNAYKGREQHIGNVSVDPAGLRTSACVRLVRWHGGRAPDSGLESEYQPAVSMIDSVIIMGQLGEVLMYQMDNVDRGSSNPMWLRKLVIERNQPRPSHADRFPTTVVAVKNQLLTLGGVPWRSCDLVGEYAGITVHYRLAHELPQNNGGGHA